MGEVIDGMEVCGHDNGSTLGYELRDGFLL